MSDVDRSVSAAVEALLQRGLDEGVSVGAAAAIGTSDGTDLVTVGTETDDGDDPVTRATRFDVASLTKPVVTTTVALRLVERGVFDLEATLGEYVDEAAGTERGDVPVRTLLTHTSGLHPYKSFPFGWESPAALLSSLYESPLALLADPDEWFVYSDLNFVHLADALRHATGASLATLAAEHVFEPAGMDTATLGPIDAGEDGTVTDVAATRDRRWRERRLRGEIHDYIGAIMAGESGNAGLFATADDLARFARALLDGGHGEGDEGAGGVDDGPGRVDGGVGGVDDGPDEGDDEPAGGDDGRREAGRVLAPSTVERLRTDAVSHLDRPHGLGWRLPHEGQPAQTWSETAFGHTGFTGTSLWIDPERDRFAVLLTNRLLTGTTDEEMAEFRRRFHAAVATDAEHPDYDQ